LEEYDTQIDNSAMVPELIRCHYSYCYDLMNDSNIPVPDTEIDNETEVTEPGYYGYLARLNMPGYLDCTEWEELNNPEDMEAFFTNWIE
jgi:hypothetical protein